MLLYIYFCKVSTLLVPVCESICKSLWCTIVCDCSCVYVQHIILVQYRHGNHFTVAEKRAVRAIVQTW